jgi:hypothetical protein
VSGQRRFKRWVAKTDPDTTRRLLELTRVVAVREQEEYQPSSAELMSMVKELCSRYGVPVQYHHYYIALAEEFWRLRRRHDVQAVSPDVDGVAVKWLLKGLDETLIYAIGKIYGFEAFAYMSRLKVSTLVEVIAKGSLTADGSEQTLMEYTGLATVHGYVDLGNMVDGDSVTIRVYVKIREGGDYRLYRSDVFTNKQAEPALYLLPRLSGFGFKVTLQQTAGTTFKSFDYLFTKGL